MDQKLLDIMNQSTHIIWLTCGSKVPKDMMEQYFSKRLKNVHSGDFLSLKTKGFWNGLIPKPFCFGFEAGWNE